MQGVLYVIEKLGQSLAQAEQELAQARAENDVLRQQLAEAQGGKDEAD